MKKIIQLLFCFCLGLAFTVDAQTYNVYTAGSIIDGAGNGIPNFDVDISLIINNSQNSYSTVQTDANGNFAETVQVPTGTQMGFISAGITDCNGNFLFTTRQFSENNPYTDSILLSYCIDCDVSIGLDSTNTGDVILIAYPTGTAPFAYSWNTGENTPTIVVTSWGINYCVTVTDADGCVSEACLYNPNSCSVNIEQTPSGALVAYPGGVSPYSFVWSNGNTSQSISPNAPGQYCVSITDVTGCMATDCFWFNGNPNNCSVYVTYDTLNTGNYFTAIAAGSAPFSYQWNTGQNTQSVPFDPNNPGPYCVTVTDATGCTSTGCSSFNPCSVYIIEEDSAGYDVLVAIGSPWTISYNWSTGETSQYIVVTNPGTYCVSVTGAGCTATACYNYQPPSNFNIAGYLYFPDSLNNPAPMQGIVELYFNDPTTNTWDILATTDIESDPNGWSNYYNFGTQSTAGEYIVKATLDPNSPGASEYMPTYHFSTVHWDEANLITLPSSGWGLFNIILSDGQNLVGGSGNINGTVTEGDGFTANDDNNRSGDPRPNTSVLLFDSNEQPITHTLTDDQGQYSFSNLPFGTYKLEVEIVGVEQAVRWVTLSANNPSSTGNDFEVTPDGIVLGIEDFVSENDLLVAPNPTTGLVNIGFEAKSNFEATINVMRADGQTISTANQAIAQGKQSLQVDFSQLADGLYFLQITTGNGVISRKIIKQ